MKSFVIPGIALILLSGCGGTAQTKPAPVSVPTPKASIVPVPDNIGVVLQCDKCVFVEEQGQRFIAGQLRNSAKQALFGYVLAVDLQDAKGKSVKKIPGLMLMNVMRLDPGETKDFKERVLSTETNVVQATVFFKMSGKDVKLSDSLTLKLNAPPATPTPTPRKKAAAPKR